MPIGRPKLADAQEPPRHADGPGIRLEFAPSENFRISKKNPLARLCGLYKFSGAIRMSKNYWDHPDAEPWDSDAPGAVWDFLESTKHKHMTNLQIDDVLGFGALLRAAAVERKNDLLAEKYDPTDKIASTEADALTLTTAETQAKAAKLVSDDKAAAAEKLKQKLYTELSTWCDAMAGSLGKTTPKGKAMLAIRSKLTGSRRKKANNAAKKQAKQQDKTDSTKTS